MTNAADDYAAWCEVIEILRQETVNGTISWNSWGPAHGHRYGTHRIEGMPQFVRVSPEHRRVSIEHDNGASWTLPLVPGTDQLVDAVDRQLNEVPPFAEEFLKSLLGKRRDRS